jgi:AcrR family transcriptional regulator
MTDSAPRTARERARAEITAEILDAARGYLATDGAPALSLRAIARDLGMASSALYRYFSSRDQLLTRLIIDAYDSLGAAAEAAEVAVDRNDLAGRFAATCIAVRDWALAHPNEYALIYGSPVPGYVAPADTVRPASRVTTLLLRIIVEAAAAGRIPDADIRDAEAQRVADAVGYPRPAGPARADGVDKPVRRHLVRALRPAAQRGRRTPRRPRRLLRRIHPPLARVHRHQLTPTRPISDSMVVTPYPLDSLGCHNH